MTKVALVTGAGKGIGRGIALELGKAGYDVAVHYARSRDGAAKIADKIEAMGQRSCLLQADIRNVQEIKAMFQAFEERFDRLDVLVNNAGITKMAPFLEVEESMWDQVVHTDLKGSFFCSQAAARLMVEKKIPGTILHISSNHSQGCWPDSTVYASAKAGLDKLTKNMALDLAPYGIRTVAIAPGYTQLEWFDARHQAYRDKTAGKIPLQRFAVPEEIGKAVVYLSSKDAGYITGTTLFMDGGALLPVVAQNRYQDD